MATSTVSFTDTVYWASGGGIAGVSFSKTDYEGLNPVDAIVEYCQEESGESSTLEFLLDWPGQVENGDIITFSYDSSVGEYTDANGFPMQDASFEITNCRGYGGVPGVFEGGWFNGDEAMIESNNPEPMPDSRFLTISYWYKSGTNPGETMYNRALIGTSSETKSGRPTFAGEAVSITTNALGKLVIDIDGVTGLERVFAKSAEALPQDDDVAHNLLIAIDSLASGTHPAVYAYIDDTELTLDIEPYIGAGEKMQLSEQYWWIGINGPGPDNNMLGCVDHVYATNYYMAIKYQAIRDIFHDGDTPIYLGASGEYPTANAAFIYLNGFSTPLLLNKGTGVDFVPLGRWQDCGTPPLPPAYESEVLEDGPVLYLRMEAGSSMLVNSAEVLDVEDATFSSVDEVAGVVDGASKYNGLNVDPDKTYIQGPHYDSIRNLGNTVGGSDATYEALIYLDPLQEGSGAFITGKGPYLTGNGSYAGWYIFLGSDGFFYFISHYGQYAGYQKCLKKPIFGEWFHFVYHQDKLNGTDWEFSTWYFDGVPFGTEILGEGPGGAIQDDGALPFRHGIRIREFDLVSDIPLLGYLDEVAWYDKELTQERILAHYTSAYMAPKPPRLVTSLGDQLSTVNAAEPTPLDVQDGFYPGSGTPAVYTIVDLPPGLLFDGQFITGTPTTDGTYNTVITCTTGVNPPANDAITWVVDPEPPAYSKQVIIDDPCFFMRLEAGSKTGNNNATRLDIEHASVIQNVTTVTGGIVGSDGQSFAGVDSYIEVPTYGSVNGVGNGQCGFEGLAYLDIGSVGNGMLLTKGPGTGDGLCRGGWYIYHRTSDNKMVIVGAYSNYRPIMSLNTPLPVGQWFHWALTWQPSNPGGTGKGWINGVSTGVTEEHWAGGFAIGDSNMNIRLGIRKCEDTGVFSNPLNGRLDEVSIWDRFLTDAEIATRFALTGL